MPNSNQNFSVLQGYVFSIATIRIFLVAGCIFLLFPIHSMAQKHAPVYRPKLGLVLSGGGAKGFAHIGALKVFEEAGLHFDYIGGTSMGSIVGGMYAAGYSPDSMVSLVRKQSWNDIMNDKIPRKFIPIEEKQNADRFVITFPIKKRKIQMKQGLVTGQLIELLLSRITSPVYMVSDFDYMPTPFVCVATDLVNGENVVIRKGQLQQAIRASMSIPSYFRPVELDGRLLVDGGVVNNYPVKEVRDLGADIIIGVDVQTGLYTKDELNSMVRVLDQVTSFYRMSSYEKGMSETDIYIQPDLVPYSIMSFSDYDSIINRGERDARKFLPQLKRLADSLNAIEPVVNCVRDAQPLDSVYVVLIEYRGLKNVSKSFINGTLAIKPGTWVKLDELENRIKHAYGSGFFEYITYSLLPIEGKGSYLLIDAKEASSGILGAGIHYDSDYKVGFLLNATFKNVLFKGSKAFIDLSLGENPKLSAFYLIDRGGKPGFGMRGTAFTLKLNSYSNGSINESFKVVQYKAESFLHFNFENSVKFRTGTEFEYIKFESIIHPENSINYSPMLSFFVNWGIDTYDKASFPTSGVKMNATGKYVTLLGNNTLNKDFSNAFSVYAMYNQCVPVLPKHVFSYGVSLGVVLNNKIPTPQHWFILGGQTYNNYYDTFIPFTGLRFIEKSGLSTFVTKFAWQYNVYGNFYLTAKWDLGIMDDNFEKMLNEASLISGFGLSVGYNSFIGPVEVSFMGTNLNKGMTNFINIGYTF